MSDPSPILSSTSGHVQILQLNHPKPQNPLNEAMRLALIHALQHADQDPAVGAIVLTGGEARSFCAGGDFAEVSQLNTGNSVATWIEAILELYIAILSVNKPVVVALDGYAIGIGLQLAVLADWRIASTESKLSMWELKAGVACTVGACILAHCLGRNAATQLIYGCQLLSGTEALDARLVEEAVPAAAVLTRALERAAEFATYPAVPFSATKQCINASLIEALRQNAPISVRAHMASFAAKSSESHMRHILNA